MTVALSAISLAIAVPTVASAGNDDARIASDDDLAIAATAVGDDTLDRTRGTGGSINQSIQVEEDELGDGGLSQTVDIGSINAGNGFNNSNAVAVAIIQQHAVQIIGSGGVDGNTGN